MPVSRQSLIHDSVLLEKTVLQLLEPFNQQKAQGVFVDATFGRGGHSRFLLENLADDARLIVFDKDPEAIAVAHEMAEKDRRMLVIHDSFACLRPRLLKLGIYSVDGIMADLGVSSPQLDDGSRGFSFLRDGAVDMRMDTTRGQPVADWLKTVDEQVLADVLYEYGEEKYSRRIAHAIKQMDDYSSTLALAETIKQAHPNWQKGKHPATQSFQAMRIFINHELEDLDIFLEQSLSMLKTGRVLAVISFHSLEDRKIKQFFQRHSKGYYPEDEKLPIRPQRPKYFMKPNRFAPSEEEVSNNPRARSAWLRSAKRTSIEFGCFENELEAEI